MGWALRLARKSAGLTILELANQAGVSERTVRGIESGTQFPSGETLAKLAATLNLSVDDLTGTG